MSAQIKYVTMTCDGGYEYEVAHRAAVDALLSERDELRMEAISATGQTQEALEKLSERDTYIAQLEESVSSLTADLQDAIAEREGMRADAERYRSLRTELSGVQAFSREIEVLFTLPWKDGMQLKMNAEGLDAYIDELAAYQQPKEVV